MVLFRKCEQQYSFESKTDLVSPISFAIEFHSLPPSCTKLFFMLLVHGCQPRTQDLSFGKTLVAAGHVPCPKFSARGCVGKVSNYITCFQ